MVFWKRLTKNIDPDHMLDFKEVYGVYPPVVDVSYHCDGSRPVSAFPGHNIEITREEYEKGIMEEEAYDKQLDKLKSKQYKVRSDIINDTIKKEEEEGTAKYFGSVNSLMDYYKAQED